MRIILLSLLLLLSGLTFSQQALVITGTISDADSGKPLPYAHVGIPERGIGTTTGLDGAFLLRVPDTYAASELSVSYIGYETYRQPLSRISSPAAIRLRAVPASLQEVIVMDERAIEDIIRKAVRHIPDNYPDYPTSQLAFYRESRTDAKQDHLYLAEGVLHVYKTRYSNDKEGQVGLVQGRKVLLIPSEELEQKSGFSSGHLAAHRFDFVKYREDFIDPDQFPDYQYWLERVTSYAGKPVYVIAFDKAEGRSGRMKGRVFIDTLSYAFLRAEFEIRPEALKRFNDYPLYSGRWKGNRYTVNYRKVGEKWFFSDALREGVYRDGGVYSNEILITEMMPGKGKQVPYMERLGREAEFLNLTGEYDEDFWRDYNTTPLASALKETVVQIRNQEKAEEVFDSTFLAQLQSQRDSVASLEASTTGTASLPTMEKEEDENERERFSWRFQAMAGTGLHFLYSEAAEMQLAYLESEDGPAIISTANGVDVRSMEPLLNYDFNLFFHEHFFVRFGWARSLSNSVYRERALGLGAQYNLSRQRPFFVRAIVQHSNLRYARFVGNATNDFGQFKVDKKKFNADKISMYYGSRTHNLRLSLELALELNPSLELFIRGSFRQPFARQQHIYLRERGQLFPKRERIALDGEVLVERNGSMFDGRITDESSLAVTVGVVFK